MMACRWALGQETFAHRVVQEPGQVIEVSLDVEDAGAGFE